MLKSMTAYGHACLVLPIGRFVVELHSVNRKHLEIATSLPKELLRFDGDIKRWISAAVGRGQVNVKMSVSFDQESPLVITPNLALARQLKSAWRAIAQDLGVSLSADLLLKLVSDEEQVLVYEENLIDEEQFRQGLQEVVTQALRHLVSMKLYEGKMLYDDISGRFVTLAKLVESIAVKAPDATLRYRQRLKERLNEALGSSIENDERLLREVCVFAEKVDIAEEITRFQSHLTQVNRLLDSQNGESSQGIGKKLEFLLQELLRETNTMGSKASDIDVSHWVVDIKTELERIREQIQNIE